MSDDAGVRRGIRLTDIGEGVAEAEVVQWYVSAGDQVDADQPFVELLTDKASLDITTPAAGVIDSVCGQPGDFIAVGADLAILTVAADSDAAASLPEPLGDAPATPATAPSPQDEGAPPPLVAPAPTAGAPSS